MGRWMGGQMDGDGKMDGRLHAWMDECVDQ